jgi:hypothetical protein
MLMVTIRNFRMRMESFFGCDGTRPGLELEAWYRGWESSEAAFEPQAVAERGGGMQVELVFQEETKLVLPTEEGEARDMAGLELHEHVDVAVVAKIGTQHRSEKCELSDVVPAAKGGDLLVLGVQVRAH